MNKNYLTQSQKKTLADIQQLYSKKLYYDVIPFWERFSPDTECGGYFTCLDRDGSVYDYDKYTWLQARQVWMFSHLYNRIEKKKSWLEQAENGIQFLTSHAIDKSGRHYFSLSCDGKPLVAPYNIYSDCFAAMAYAEYAHATQNKEIEDLAYRTYSLIQQNRSNPKGKYEKHIIENRSFRAFGFSMIELNMAQVLKRFQNNDLDYEETITRVINDVCAYHISEEDKVVYERVSLTMPTPFCMESRLLCPGHACEVIWFLAKAAEERKDVKLISLLTRALKWTLERGWDKEYGGLFYYQDVQGLPTEKLESEMKLWWVHAEAIYATLLLYSLSSDIELYQWFLRLHTWAWEHFNDDINGEWFGYLYRDGEKAKSLKGSKWKGFFHLPRFLLESDLTLKSMLT